MGCGGGGGVVVGWGRCGCGWRGGGGCGYSGGQPPEHGTMDTMSLTINGDNRVFSAETLGAIVEHLGMKPDRVAIELNREIVPRDQWPQTSLHDGDRLEIVHFVGGGSRYQVGLATRLATC